MKKSAYNYLTGALALLTLGIAVSGLQAAMTAGSGRHLSEQECAGCHLAGNDVTPENAKTLTASQEALCVSCHPKAVKVSHPSGLKPKKALPEAYPVDWKGDLTCSTCHEIHGDGHGLMRGDARGKTFCQSCHDAAFFQSMRDGGASLSGHLGAESMDSALLDSYSAECMSCHENNGNVNLVTSIDQQGVIRHAGGSAPHPIGSEYEKAARFGGYRNMTLLSKNIILPNGKMSCISCHQGYTQKHGAIVEVSSGNTLCYECHDL